MDVSLSVRSLMFNMTFYDSNKSSYHLKAVMSDKYFEGIVSLQVSRSFAWSG